jgi:hypothetical protein
VPALVGFPLPRTSPIELSYFGASVVPVVDLLTAAGIFALWLVRTNAVKQVVCSHRFLTSVHDAKAVGMVPCGLCIDTPKVSSFSLFFFISTNLSYLGKRFEMSLDGALWALLSCTQG